MEWGKAMVTIVEEFMTLDGRALEELWSGG